jgi:hypothetical protein
MAVCERRNDRPAALARSEAEDGETSDLVVSRGMTAQPAGEEDRERAIAGQRSASHASASKKVRMDAWTRAANEITGAGTHHRSRRRHRSTCVTRAQQKAIPLSPSKGEGLSRSCN